MTATSTLISTETSERIQVISDQVTKNYTSSATFMKQLTTVAVSTLAFFRDLYPIDNYITEKFGGVNVKILKRKCQNEDAQFLSTSLTEAYQAFDDNYLEKLAVCFYEGDETKAENIIEYWLFEYTYNEGGVSMNFQSSNKGGERHSSTYTSRTFNEIKKQIEQLLKNIMTLLEQRSKRMPKNITTTVRLYYNKNAPDGYQPIGYIAVLEDKDHLEPTLSKNMKMGRVETPFHAVTTKAYFYEDLPDSYVPNISSTPPMLSQFEYNSGVSPQTHTSHSSRQPYSCPCNLINLDDSEEAYLICKYCNMLQHAVCYGINREDAPNIALHCCTDCWDANPERVPTDPNLAERRDSQKRESLAKYRRILQWTCENTSLSKEDLIVRFQLKSYKAMKLIQEFYNHGIITEKPVDSIGKRYKVTTKAAEFVRSNCFRKSHTDETIVQEVITESLSQGSQPDPVRDALGPQEVEKLQSTSTLGKVIPVCPQTEENPLLKECRDALLPTKEVDLPLSGGKKENITFRKRRANREVKTGIKTKKIKNN